MSESEQPFWRTKSLADMGRAEWESLCDGCAKCCLIKLEDEDTGAIEHTNVACRLLDLDTCRCTRYGRRKRLVQDCIKLSTENIGALGWLPSTCAYRLIAEGRDLPEWHPLITGDPETVHRAGISVRGRVVPENQIDEYDLEDHIVDWPGEPA